MWSLPSAYGLVRLLLERRYRGDIAYNERLLHHQRCTVLVDSPLYCVQWETISLFERESTLEGNVHTHVSCRSKTEGPQRRNARHRVTLSVPTTPLSTRMRATRFRSPPQHHERINRWKRTPPRGWCTHYSSSRRRDHRIAVTRRVYACFAMRIRRGVDIRAQLLAVGKFREGLLVGRRLESSRFSVFVGGGWLDIFWWREARERTRIEVIRWNWRGAWVARYGITVCGRVSTS